MLKEVQKLLDVGFIKKCYYLDWLANIVIEKKLKISWLICVNLNKAYLNYSFLLPKSDQMVDSISGHGYLTFTNACSNFYKLPI